MHHHLFDPEGHQAAAAEQAAVVDMADEEEEDLVYQNIDTPPSMDAELAARRRMINEAHRQALMRAAAHSFPSRSLPRTPNKPDLGVYSLLLFMSAYGSQISKISLAIFVVLLVKIEMKVYTRKEKGGTTHNRRR